MREILFRGKRKDNGEWVEGYYARKGVDKDTFKHFICVMTFNVNGNTYSSMFYLTDIEVIPETVGQYTGMTDKNGKKVFEGDIVKVENVFVRGIFAVEYSGMGACFIVSCGESRYFLGGCNSEVIGNIHDNPELLKE